MNILFISYFDPNKNAQPILKDVNVKLYNLSRHIFILDPDPKY